MQFSPSLLESIQSAPEPIKILGTLLFCAICIKQIIKQLSSKTVRNFVASCAYNVKELGRYLNELSIIPHLPKKPKPSWFVVIMMSLISGSLFCFFMILVVLGLYPGTTPTFGQLLLLSCVWFTLVFVARCFYAAAHRERAKILKLE